MKTNTFALNNGDGQQLPSQNSFGGGVKYQGKGMNQNQQNPYDNAQPLHSGNDLLGHQSVNAARNTFYVSDNQR